MRSDIILIFNEGELPAKSDIGFASNKEFWYHRIPSLKAAY